MLLSIAEFLPNDVSREHTNPLTTRILVLLVPLDHRETSMGESCIPRACKITELRSGERLNPFPDDKFKIFPNRKSLQKTISNLMKMAENSQNW